MMQQIEPINFEPPSIKHTRKKPSKFPIIFLVILGLILLAGVFFILLSTKSVSLTTFPESTQTSIDTPWQLGYANHYLLFKGEYDIRLNAEGYHDLNSKLSLTDDKYQELEYRLKPLPGKLQIKTNTEDTAKIFIDDKEVATTPTTIENLEQGDYKLRVETERYFPYEENINIEGLGKTQTLELTLKPAWAEFSFSSSPDDASIIIDDETLGKTPATIEILNGERQISINKNGFKPWKKSVIVKAEENMSFDDIKLIPADATLRLSSTPTNANVTLNDTFIGHTPLTLALTPGQTARLRLYKQGFLAKTTSVTAKSGDNKKLTVTMLPELVDVTLKVTPADAEILVNGKRLDASKGSIALSTTPQTITARKNGYVEKTTTITPRHGVNQEVSITLKTLQQQKQENIKPAYTNSIGQKLKLFYPYDFTMGASRREPGRRSNEAIHNARLKRPFYLSIYETTNAEFRRFQRSHKSGSVQGQSLDTDKKPVANITWEQAALFCNWLSQKESLSAFYTVKNNKIIGIDSRSDGYRLPSEAEWAWAARSRSKQETLKFSWGNSLPPPAKTANFADINTASFLGNIIKDYDDGYSVSAPVGKFPANHKGLYDIDGNVAEWVNDYYSIYTNNATTPIDSFGPKSGEFHVIRGASWSLGSVSEIRLSYRDYSNKARDDVGFRVARYLEQ